MMIDAQRARKILHSRWKKITPETKDFIEDKRLIGTIRRIVDSKTVSYRYALPTQTLAKATDPSVDSRCMQKKRGGLGAFDARSFCKKVIVEFDRQNNRVLGRSGDPYVSKPLRHEEISKKYRSAIKDKEGWDDLCFVLNKIENLNDPAFTFKMLNQTLLEIYRRLSEIKVRYPIPRRVDLQQSVGLLEEYLSEPSKGVRPEVFTYSLFKTVGERFNLFKHIVSSKTTAPNHFMGRVADIECCSQDGRVELAVMVRDTEVTAKEIEDELPKVREQAVPNFIVVPFKGVKKDEEREIGKLIKREFASGQNIHIVDPVEFSRALMILFGEDGRRKFLENMGQALDEYASYEHRKKWAELLTRL